jgi:transposase
MEKSKLKKEVLSLYRQGMSYGKIAEKLGIGKTTVYSWIVNSSNPKENVRNTIQNENRNVPNEFEELKEELREDYGTDKEIAALVELRKAEMEHTERMEKIELEREKLLQNKKMEEKAEREKLLLSQIEEIKSKLESEQQKSERLQAELSKFKNENSKLRLLIQTQSAETKKKELPASLKNICSENIRSYHDLENEKIFLEDVSTALENTKSGITTISNWIKSNKQKKSDFPELSILKEIKKSLEEMVAEFDEDEDIRLVFDFNPDFKEKLSRFL